MGVEGGELGWGLGGHCHQRRDCPHWFGHACSTNLPPPKRTVVAKHSGCVVQHNICKCHQTARQQLLPGFRGVHNLPHTGLPATTWVPMGAQPPILSPNDHPNPSQGQKKGFQKIEFAQFLLPTASPPPQNIQVAEFAIIHHFYQHHGSPWLYTYSHCHQMITQQ